MSGQPGSHDSAGAAATTTVKPSYDPGWNDPPMMAYTNPTGATISIAQKPKLLNKRIAFPIESSLSASTTKVQTSDAGLPMPFARVKHQPPPPLGFAPPPTSSSPPKHPPLLKPTAAAVFPAASENVEHVEEDQSAIMDATLRRLHNTLDECNSFFEAGRRQELEKRLGLLSTAWTEGQLDTALQRRLRDLSLALQCNDQLAEATELHRSLAVDYGTISAPWAAALRSLILAKQPKVAVDEQTGVVEDDAGVLLDTTCDDMQKHMRPNVYVPGQVQHL